MKITVHMLASDDGNGTHAEAFGTDEASVDALLEAQGLDRAMFLAWQAENDENETGLWDYLEAHGSKSDLDTYNLDEQDVEFDLYAQPLPATGLDQAREAVECLRRARDLMKAAGNRQTLDRVRLALSSAKGAVRIQDYRRARAQQEADKRAAEADVNDATPADYLTHAGRLIAEGYVRGARDERTNFYHADGRKAVLSSGGDWGTFIVTRFGKEG